MNNPPVLVGGVAIGGSLLAALGYRKWRLDRGTERRKETEQRIKDNYRQYLKNFISGNNTNATTSS